MKLHSSPPPPPAPPLARVMSGRGVVGLSHFSERSYRSDLGCGGDFFWVGLENSL